LGALEKHLLTYLQIDEAHMISVSSGYLQYFHFASKKI